VFLGLIGAFVRTSPRDRARSEPAGEQSTAAIQSNT
jgi:hypothetical protein